MSDAALDAVVHRYEDAWQRGVRPVLEGYLPAGDTAFRMAALRRLAAAELRLRQDDGEPATWQEYLEQYPELADADADGESVSGDRPAPLPPAATTAGRVILVVLNGALAGRQYELDCHQTLLAGRSKRAHLWLKDDPHFSHNHFLLEALPPRCYLRDLGSRRGTFVNDHRVTETLLADGDVIGGGQTRIRVRLQPGSQPPSGDFCCLACGASAASALDVAPPDLGPPGSFLCDACRAGVLRHPDPVPGYRIERPLGHGGPGVVYLARREGTGDPVTLQLAAPEPGQRAFAEFLDAVGPLRQLDHPRIARLHEAGMARGQFYFVSEYVESIDLTAELARLPPEKAARTACGVVCQLLEGLHVAHEHGLIHGNLKPANLLVVRAGAKLRTKVADFGLARLYEDFGFAGLTRNGETLGALAFTAPEQVRDCRYALPSADLYAAGAVLYHLLAGRPHHDFPARRDRYAVVLEDEAASLKLHRPRLPSGLTELVHKSVARRRRARFTSAAEMFHALLPFAQG
jgi:eukaryotic-like serine/threonine-protein kinase